MGGNQSVDNDGVADKHGISSEEAKMLIAAFTDHNKKGKPITLPAFRKIAAKVNAAHPNASLSGPTVDLCFTYFDGDHSGKLDLDEFIAGITVLAGDSIEKKAELVFHAIDKDNNGTLDRKEVTDFVSLTLHMAKVIARAEKKASGKGKLSRMKTVPYWGFCIYSCLFIDWYQSLLPRN
eukprot:TRINITY_DN1717_c0_g1_i1.p1 TRINITY_DN1717_c0_g1~~TRINITY_DN1717_c0_g1_i1.p1  ORF type:complete len:179 (-),score=44.18 TRINITY_DN1717_c0_g1_i1:317-853(-)